MNDELIVSSILVEIQGPEGDQHAYWFVRTPKQAFHSQFTNGELDDGLAKVPISVHKYDEALKAMSSWQQAPSSGQDGLTGSYDGFLSLYDQGKSRQMLLTVGDVQKADGEGRLLHVLGELLKEIDEGAAHPRSR